MDSCSVSSIPISIMGIRTTGDSYSPNLFHNSVNNYCDFDCNESCRGYQITRTRERTRTHINKLTRLQS